MKYIIGTVLFFLSLSSSAADFDWQNMSILYSKIYPDFDYDQSIEDYIKEYHPQKWKLLQNDEFILEEKKQEYVDELKRKVASYNMDESFNIRTTIKLGKYNFEKQEFPIIEGVSSQSYFYTGPKNIRPHHLSSYPQRYKLFLNNSEGVRFEMGKEDAKEFVKNRKSSSGHVDRTVGLEMNIKIIGFRGQDKVNEFIGSIETYRFDLTED